MKSGILGLCLLCMTVSLLLADDDLPSLTQRTFKRLVEIERSLSNDQIDEAQKRMDTLLERNLNRPADRAYAYQMQANLLLYREDYESAIDYLTRSYAENALGRSAQLGVLRLLGYLSSTIGDDKRAIDYLNQYLNTEGAEPDAEMFLVLGSAYYQQQQYSQAIDALTRGRELSSGNKSILSLLFNSHYALDHYSQAIRILEEMVRSWPEERRYWQQLAALHLQLDQYEKALEVFEIAEVKGFMSDESTVLQYAYLLLESGLPYKAAKRLEIAMQEERVSRNHQNQSMLAALWMQARESNNALQAYELAAQWSVDGRESFYIAQLYYEQNEFEQALRNAESALERGVTSPGEVHLLMAASALSLEQPELARKHLQQAEQDEQVAERARLWLAETGL